MQRVCLLPLQSSRAAQCSGWLRHWDRRRWQPQSCHCWSKNCRRSGTTWLPSEEGHDGATLGAREHERAYASTDPLFTLKCDANEDFSHTHPRTYPVMAPSMKQNNILNEMIKTRRYTVVHSVHLLSLPNRLSGVIAWYCEQLVSSRRVYFCDAS